MELKLVTTPAEFEDWCRRNSFSKADVARILGVSRQTIYNLTKSRAPKFESDDCERAYDSYSRLPEMLSLALHAIETIGPEYFGRTKLLRENARKQFAA